VEKLRQVVGRLRVSRLLAGVFIVLSVLAGYLVASWWHGFGSQDVTPLQQICGRVEHLGSLVEELHEQGASTEEMRNQLAMLMEQCQEALGNSIEQNE
jgi:hypothetical protein